ncbi:LLM class flavin-dependent oxidoreductase [Nonomuraea sp. 3N208]|uniref:LLM class flavin-dependent oxidoreductase n=1 Tax=Nonomuraea sp. 3N208 TaxID=3457421 RepID=UPI003FCF5964
MFGLGLSTTAAPGADPVGDARVTEELEFDFVSASDHPCAAEPTYEVWTLLTWVAANEFRAFGLGVPSPREKVDGMVEGIHIIRGLWSEPAFTFHGSRYRTERADLEPKPDRPIPIWLGTYGKRALEATGRLADGWIPSYGFAPPEQATVLRERVLAAAETSGRTVTCVYNVPVHVGEPQASEGVVSGSAEEVAERLLTLSGLGFSSMNLTPVGDFRQQTERLASDVVPIVRAV